MLIRSFHVCPLTVKEGEHDRHKTGNRGELHGAGSVLSSTAPERDGVEGLLAMYPGALVVICLLCKVGSDLFLGDQRGERLLTVQPPNAVQTAT